LYTIKNSQLSQSKVVFPKEAFRFFGVPEGKKIMLIASNYACKPCDEVWYKINSRKIVPNKDCVIRVLHNTTSVPVEEARQLARLSLHWGSGERGMDVHMYIVNALKSGSVPSLEHLQIKFGKPLVTGKDIDKSLAFEDNIVNLLGSTKTP
jgi:hypothetical protein